MFRFSVMVAFCCTVGLAQADINPRIIDGTPTSAGEHDYFVALMLAYNWDRGVQSLEPITDDGRHSWNPFCGAAYIGDGLVVTAAHCVADLPASGNLNVLVGNYTGPDMQYEHCSDEGFAYSCVGNDSKTDGVVANKHFTGFAIFTGSEDELIPVPVDSIVVHPWYNSKTLNYDIAILKLPEAINNPALSLPTADLFASLAATGNADNVMVLGHGDTLSDNISTSFEASADLMKVEIAARGDGTCTDYFGSNFNTTTMICAGDPGQDSCQGDSGGPLIDPTSNTLLGVVSWGPGVCGNQAESYGVYADVYQFTEWIESRGLYVDGIGRVGSDGEVYRMGRQAGVFGVFGVIATLILIALRVRS